jgi:acyl-CoA synthetase (AMP-forming)/AMP-acid ligase II
VADVRFVSAGTIPRTTSGKLARYACRAEYLAGAFAG